MNRKIVTGLLLATLGLVAQTASAATLSWVELGLKSSPGGVVFDNPYGTWPPPAADLSGFDSGTGIGSIKYTFSGAGSHYVAGFFDYQFVDAPLGDGLDDEYGIAHGSAGSGLSWEIDDSFGGDIYAHFSGFDGATPLPDTLDLPSGTPGDVAVALGYAFTLSAGADPLSVIFTVSKTAPSSGFYLEHRNPLSQESVFFSLSSRTGTPAPEPATMTLLGLGLVAATRRLRRRT